MNELKHCPFCGDSATMDKMKASGEKMPRYRVRCQGCWRETDWNNFSTEDAVVAWNRRANDGSVREGVNG